LRRGRRGGAGGAGGGVTHGHCFRLFFAASPSSSSPPAAAAPASTTNSIAVRNPIPSHEKDLIRRERRDRECSPGSSGSKGPSSSLSPPLRGASGGGRSGRRHGMTNPGRIRGTDGWIRGTNDQIRSATALSWPPSVVLRKGRCLRPPGATRGRLRPPCVGGTQELARTEFWWWGRRWRRMSMVVR